MICILVAKALEVIDYSSIIRGKVDIVSLFPHRLSLPYLVPHFTMSGGGRGGDQICGIFF